MTQPTLRRKSDGVPVIHFLWPQKAKGEPIRDCMKQSAALGSLNLTPERPLVTCDACNRELADEPPSPDTVPPVH